VEPGAPGFYSLFPVGCIDCLFFGLSLAENGSFKQEVCVTGTGSPGTGESATDWLDVG
jgi:hypothetical protein